MNKMIYLDYAAATPVSEEVMKAMQPYFSQRFFNPSAMYLVARSVNQDLAAARAQVAQVLGARPSEIIFTAGGTEANNLAIHGIMQAHPKANVVVGAVEHESVLKPANQYQYKLAPVQQDGLVDLKKLDSLIDNETVLVSVMYANNEIGTVEPIRQVAQMIETKLQARQKTGNPLPLYLHTDACQAANYLDLHVSRLGVDLMTLNGGKIYGPKQSGALYVKAGVVLKPQILGGGQELGRRSGTENMAGNIGFATALTQAQDMRANESKRLYALQQLFFDLVNKHFPQAVINGSRTQRLPNNVHITFPGYDNERLMMQLDELGILVATGSACSANSDEPSHVLAAIGLDNKAAQASLRFTLGRDTTETNIQTTIKALTTVV